MTARGIDYGALFRPLAATCRKVIALDMLGHGGTSLPENSEDFNLESVVRAVTETLTSSQVLGSEQFFVFGNSLGGFVAVKLALELKDQVLGLALASPAGHPMEPEKLDQVRDQFDMGSHSKATAFVDLIKPVPESVGIVHRHIMAWYIRSRATSEGSLRFIENIGKERLLEAKEVQQLSCAVLLVWGKQERIFDRDALEFWVGNLPDHLTTVITPDDCGHVSHIDQLDEVTGAMNKFIVGIGEGMAERPLLAAPAN
ncbi:unnamed protein product [Chrysoparadoxa australica]